MTVNVIPLPFSGDLIDYIKLHGREIEWLWRDGEAYIPARPICELLGLSWSRQRKILTDPETEATVAFKATVAEDGKQREMLCVAYPDFMMWLAGITPSRVKEEARDAVRATRNEIKALIATHYHDRLLGESREATRMLQAFITDWVVQKPIRGRVVFAVDNGWSFETLWKSGSYSKKYLVSTIREAIRIGAIAHALAGTPQDAPQLDLFSQEG